MISNYLDYVQRSLTKRSFRKGRLKRGEDNSLFYSLYFDGQVEKYSTLINSVAANLSVQIWAPLALLRHFECVYCALLPTGRMVKACALDSCAMLALINAWNLYTYHVCDG